MPRSRALQGRDIGGHDMGQKGCADFPVRRAEHGPQRGGEPVHGPESGVGQGHAREQGGQGHVRARREIRPMGRGPAQGARGPDQAVAAQGVGQGAGRAGHEALQKLGQGVHARGRGLPRGQGNGQFRIHHGQVGDEPRRAQADLDPVTGGQQHGVGRDLGPGPGRGRQRDHGQGRMRKRQAPPDDLQVVEHVARIGRQGGQGLARVQDAPSAHGHDHVAAVSPRGLGLPGNEGGVRLSADGHAEHVRHHGPQVVQQPGRALGAASGHQQAAPAQPRRPRRGLGAGADAEEHAGREKRRDHVASCLVRARSTSSAWMKKNRTAGQCGLRNREKRARTRDCGRSWSPEPRRPRPRRCPR